MKVEINGHTCTIGWQYESKVIEKACKKYRVFREDLKGFSKKAIAENLNLKAFPLPDSTHCIITDTVTGDVYTGTVKRFHKDPWSRETARKNALTKALESLFPENREQRKKIWDVYHNRRANNSMTNIEKAIRKGLFTKDDLLEYSYNHFTVTGKVRNIH